MMLNWYYSIRNGIKNIIKWFPIIWEDDDWDYGYLDVLVAKKLDGMYKSMKAVKHLKSVDHDKIVRRLFVAKVAAHRLAYRNYGFDDNYYHSKLPEQYYHMEFRDDYRIIFPNTTKHFDVISKKSWELAESLERQDREIVGKFMTKYIRKCWW